MGWRSTAGFATAVAFLIADGSYASASRSAWEWGCATTLGNIHNGGRGASRTAAERKRDQASRRLVRILGPAP